MNPPVSACEYSQQMGESLVASAPFAESWLLLEYPRPWAAKAYAESAIPDPVKAYLDAQLAAMPNGRLQLIARGTRVDLTDLALYIIDARPGRARARRFTLATYDALTDLPLAAIAQGEQDAGEAVTEAVYIVCTNGRRDTCCALHGLPVYNALRAVGGAHVWQCDHLGGHRFAGTLVAFPYGDYYGRARAADAEEIAEAGVGGALHLPLYRGRAALPAHVQAADYYLRNATGITGLDALAVTQIETVDGDWRVRFTSAAAAYDVRVAAEPTPFDIISNSSDTSGKPGTQYRLLSLELVTA